VRNITSKTGMTKMTDAPTSKCIAPASIPMNIPKTNE